MQIFIHKVLACDHFPQNIVIPLNCATAEFPIIEDSKNVNSLSSNCEMSMSVTVCTKSNLKNPMIQQIYILYIFNK